VVFGDRGIGNQILALRTAEAVVFFLVNQLALQVLAVPHAAAPQRNVGSRLLTLERANDVRRAVTTIGGRFADCNLVVLSHAFQLREIRLVGVIARLALDPLNSKCRSHASSRCTPRSCILKNDIQSVSLEDSKASVISVNLSYVSTCRRFGLSASHTCQKTCPPRINLDMRPCTAANLWHFVASARSSEKIRYWYPPLSEGKQIHWLNLPNVISNVAPRRMTLVVFT
jgi:hypothetical protein